MVRPLLGSHLMCRSLQTAMDAVMHCSTVAVYKMMRGIVNDQNVCSSHLVTNTLTLIYDLYDL